MLTIHEQTTDNSLQLKLEGDATIESAEQLHQALLEGLRSQTEVQIDCSATESIDVYALQIFCSAHRTAIEWEKKLTFQGNLSAAVSQAITATGLLRDHGCSHCPDGVCCMWATNSSSDA